VCAFFIFLHKIKLSSIRSKTAIYSDEFRKSIKLTWVFSLILLITTIGGLAYLSQGALSPFGWLLRYGLIAFFAIFISLITFTGTTLTAGKSLFRRVIFSSLVRFGRMALFKRKRLIYVLTIVLAVMLFLSCFGSFRQTWLGSDHSTKLLAYEKVQSVSQFFFVSSNYTQFKMAGDTCYSSFLFFKEFLDEKSNNIISEPLRQDAITLYYSYNTNNTDELIEKLKHRGINGILTVGPDETVWGDVWGYSVKISNFDMLNTNSNRIYDGYLEIYQFT
jgi:hypothetical protein